MSPPDPGPPDLDPDPGTVRCPTCGAAQAWSDACRRCKCDLRFLREVAEAGVRSRDVCLRHLRDGRLREAFHDARRFQALAATPESLRLLAVVALRREDWPTAAALARLASLAAD